LWTWSLPESPAKLALHLQSLKDVNVLIAGQAPVIMTESLDRMPKGPDHHTMTTAKDEELLSALRANARAPVAALARALGLSRTTVQDRLKRLEEQGVIAGYTLKLTRDLAPKGIAAQVAISVEPRRQIEVAKAIGKLQQVETLHAVSGKVDFIAMVRAPTAEGIDKVIDLIGLIPGVNGIETAVILSTKLDRREGK
jgi:DNA-binding Lrp family transcriptional regulator